MPPEGLTPAGSELRTDPTPLLTIAIPTYNRAEDLERLLTSLEPQLRGRTEVDCYISDNGSADGTADVIGRFKARGMPLRSHRQPENIGSDANFVSCFHAARGRYFWLCGDDEALLPGALDLILSHLRSEPELDLLYLSSYDFEQDYLAEHVPDRLDRQHHTYRSARRLTRILNINFTFISSIVSNRERLLGLPHEDPSAFLGTNLTQLSWVLPLLRQHRRSRILLKRVLGARRGNQGGYSLARVFGKNLAEVTLRLLPDRPDLSTIILNFTVRRWFPTTILGTRLANNTTVSLEESHRVLRPIFGRNYRYWVYTYPALRLPLPLASVWVKLGRTAGRLADHARNPLFWRKKT